MFEETSSPIYLICHSALETARHQMIYQDNARTALLDNSATNKKQWLGGNDTREELAYLITSYVCGRGGISARSIMP